MITLATFLDTKPLYYNEIDYTRMPRVYEKIKQHLSKTKIIHLIGTNGKGTTGRFLATALYNLGYKTGHYTSPHILEFNERVWLNGQNASYEKLDDAHEILQTILSKEDSDSLSYFEYTTLLAIAAFKECEYVVLEAGLGGEHDATAVFDKTLTLVTPIDYDHESFLGSHIKEIATTKLNAIQNNAILANQKYEEIYEIASNLTQAKDLNIYKVNDFISTEDEQKISKISDELSLAPYLKENLKLSIAALKFLNIEYDSKSFNNSKLFGRLSKIKDNVIIDVGHNPLAADSILKALKGKKYTLIYNSYKDKDYKSILKTLKPIIKNVEIIEIDDQRIVSKELIHGTLNELKIKYSTFNNLSKKNHYLVFGSFSVVESFLNRHMSNE